jgi:hypothetical protein
MDRLGGGVGRCRRSRPSAGRDASSTAICSSWEGRRFAVVLRGIAHRCLRICQSRISGKRTSTSPLRNGVMSGERSVEHGLILVGADLRTIAISVHASKPRRGTPFLPTSKRGPVGPSGHVWRGRFSQEPWARHRVGGRKKAGGNRALSAWALRQARGPSPSRADLAEGPAFGCIGFDLDIGIEPHLRGGQHSHHLIAAVGARLVRATFIPVVDGDVAGQSAPLQLWPPAPPG